MALFKGGHQAMPFKGDRKPFALYKGDKQVAGAVKTELSGTKEIKFNTSYKTEIPLQTSGLLTSTNYNPHWLKSFNTEGEVYFFDNDKRTFYEGYQVYDSNNHLLHNFRCCQHPKTLEYCLYDLVSKKYFYNKGKGTIIPNDDFNALEYIEIENNEKVGYSNGFLTEIPFSTSTCIKIQISANSLLQYQDTNNGMLVTAGTSSGTPYISYYNTNTIHTSGGNISNFTSSVFPSIQNFYNGNIKTCIFNFQAQSNEHIRFGSWIDGVWSRTLRWHSIQILSNEKILADIIPVKQIQTQNLCFFDFVSNKYLLNEFSQEAARGKNLEPSPYLYSPQRLYWNENNHIKVQSKNLYSGSDPIVSTRFVGIPTKEIFKEHIGESVTVSFDIRALEDGFSRDSILLYAYQGKGISLAENLYFPLSKIKTRIVHTTTVKDWGFTEGYTEGSIGIYDGTGPNHYEVSNIQIELNSIPTRYLTQIPEQILKLPVLRALPDGTKDEYNAKTQTIIRRVESYSFFGTPEDQMSKPTTETPGFLNFRYLKKEYLGDNTKEPICSHFPCALKAYGNKPYGNICTIYPTHFQVIFQVSKEIFADDKAWNQFLQDEAKKQNPVTVWFARQVPIEEKTTIPPILQSWDGTIIQTGGDCGLAPMSTTIYTDFTK